MERNQTFFQSVCKLAIPVALQSMLQASFSIIDQIMIGRMGSVSVAGVGLAGKFTSVFSVLVSAIGTVAGIMISQYLGQQNKREVRRSFFLNLFIGIGLAVLFTVLCVMFPKQIMGLYTQDKSTILEAAGYLTDSKFCDDAGIVSETKGTACRKVYGTGRSRPFQLEAVCCRAFTHIDL